MKLDEIKHRTTKARRPQTSRGFVDRFNRKVLDEFFREASRKRLYEPVKAPRQDLDE